MTVHRLFDGDPRIIALWDAIEAVVLERGADLPMASVIGVLDLARASLQKKVLMLEE